MIYAAATVAGRHLDVEPRHRSVYLRGVRIPGAERVLHHDYPVTPGMARALEQARARGRRRLRLEHVRRPGGDRLVSDAGRSRTSLVVESHDEGPRPGWRRRVKGTVVPSDRSPARRGILARERSPRGSMIGARRPRRASSVFANTIDVKASAKRPTGLAARRPRAARGAGSRSPRTSSSSRSHGSHGRSVSTCWCARSPTPAIPVSCSSSWARVPSGPDSRLCAGELDVRARTASATRRGSGSSRATCSRTCSRCSRSGRHGASPSTRRPHAGCRCVLSDRVGAAP